jgi:hypothetical protein
MLGPAALQYSIRNKSRSASRIPSPVLPNPPRTSCSVVHSTSVGSPTRSPRMRLFSCYHLPIFTSLVSRCLALWDGDRELLRALELAKTFLAPTEVLNSLWPCQGTHPLNPLSSLYLPNLMISVICAAFHSRGKELRAQLSQACVSAGIPPPLPQSPDLAPFYPATRVLTSRP